MVEQKLQRVRGGVNAWKIHVSLKSLCGYVICLFFHGCTYIECKNFQKKTAAKLFPKVVNDCKPGNIESDMQSSQTADLQIWHQLPWRWVSGNRTPAPPATGEVCAYCPRTSIKTMGSFYQLMPSNLNFPYKWIKIVQCFESASWSQTCNPNP